MKRFKNKYRIYVDNLDSLSYRKCTITLEIKSDEIHIVKKFKCNDIGVKSFSYQLHLIYKYLKSKHYCDYSSGVKWLDDFDFDFIDSGYPNTEYWFPHSTFKSIVRNRYNCPIFTKYMYEFCKKEATPKDMADRITEALENIYGISDINTSFSDDGFIIAKCKLEYKPQ